ncbi:MAG: toxin ParE1/3/4 [Pyrinomonadaceae bacterium]|jgi:plasmid stabilization system protein ParE|nr:toxin ParE1/3/4 [Pyrinomonadaceae bacterium]
MSRRIVLRPEAQADLLQARDWYAQEDSELAEAFVGSFEAIIARIGAMPELYPLVLKNARRGKLRRFPYLVYYRLFSDRVEVIGVLHGSRDPRVWQQRVDRKKF